VKKEGHGIENIQKNRWRKYGHFEKSENVNTAKKNMKHVIINSNSVLTNAEIEKEEDMVLVFKKNVLSVIRSLILKGVTHCIAVLNVNQDPEEKKPVYNLVVKDAGCYYANGVLVSNCDSAASLCRAKYSKRSEARLSRYEW
jgi:hypothetical protein